MLSRTFLHAAALGVMLSASTLITGCSDDATPPATGIDRTVYAPVRIETLLTSPSVTPGEQKEQNPRLNAGTAVDSIGITKVRILVARIGMFKDRFASYSGSSTVKKGTALVAPLADGGAGWLCNGNLPTGTYNLLRLELENTADSVTRLVIPEIDSVLDAGPYSAIIEGISYSNGVATSFEYKTSALPDLEIPLSPTIVISAGAEHTMILTIDPAAIFRSNGAVLDPADPSNKETIDAHIPDAFTGLRVKDL